MNQNIKYLLYVFIIYGFGAVVIQSLLIPFIAINLWEPEMVLVIVLLIGNRFGSMAGSTSGFILGVLIDALTAMPIGISALPKAIAGYGAGKITILKMEGAIRLLWFFILIFLHEFIYYLIIQVKLDFDFVYLLTHRVFPNTIYTMLMLVITNIFTAKIFSKNP